MKSLVSIFIILLISISSFSQFNYPYEFGYHKNVFAGGITISHDSLIFMTHNTNETDTLNVEPQITAFSQVGDSLFTLNLNNNFITPYKFQYCGYGDYYISRGRFKVDNNSYKFGLIKINSQGQIIWIREYGNNDFINNKNLSICNDSGFVFSYLNGFHSNYPYNDSINIQLVKTDKYGQLEWDFTYHDSVNSTRSVLSALLNDSTIIVASGIYRAYGFNKIKLFKFNIYGQLLDSLSFVKSFQDFYLNSIFVSDSNNIYIGGEQVIYKFDQSLNLVWEKMMTAPSSAGNNNIYRIIQLKEGNFIALGDIHKSNSFGYSHQSLVIKFNNSGDTLWTKTFGRYGFEFAWDVVETKHNGLAISGTIYSEEVQAYADYKNSAYFILLNSQGEFSTSINELKETTNIRVYPNPAKDYIQINTDLINPSELEIYDISGKLILKKEIDNTSRININDYYPGLYIYKVSSGKDLITGKFIKI